MSASTMSTALVPRRVVAGTATARKARAVTVRARALRPSRPAPSGASVDDSRFVTLSPEPSRADVPVPSRRSGSRRGEADEA
jgi:hypothetical protein